MLNRLLEYLQDKKILILGFGVEGKSTYSLIRKYFPRKNIVICDKKEGFEDEICEDKQTECVHEYIDRVDEFDIIIKTPGLSFKGVEISKFENKITSQLELFLEYIDVFTIGITGTKGKSTTSSLMYNVLQKNNKNTMLLGNIGTPIFDKIDEITENTILVLELSSHALEYAKKSPNIAMLLNIYEEHLDHYNSFEEYINAKCNIFKYQKISDYAIYNIDNDIVNGTISKLKSQKISISMKNQTADVVLEDNKVYYKGSVLYQDDGKRHILGNHNLYNIMFVLVVSNILQLDFDLTIKAINEFMPLEHRMEYVGNFGQIDYYNDSIATVPEATINAIETLNKVNTLIVGGKDRGVSQQSLIDYLNNSQVKNVICLPKTGEYIANNINNKNVYLVDNLEQAVKIAKEKTDKDSVCLLSPAASSYGYFKNFEERGNLFKKYVKQNEKDDKIYNK